MAKAETPRMQPECFFRGLLAEAFGTERAIVHVEGRGDDEVGYGRIVPVPPSALSEAFTWIRTKGWGAAGLAERRRHRESKPREGDLGGMVAAQLSECGETGRAWSHRAHRHRPCGASRRTARQ